MNKIALDPPFDREMLNEIVAITTQREGVDIQGTAEWLLRHRSTADLVQSVKRAWSETSLVLAQWAERIDGVAALTREDGVGLKLCVELIGHSPACVFQDAPLEAAELASCIQGLGAPLPPILTQLATSAPGLILEDTGYIACREFFTDRLGHTKRWLADDVADSFEAPDDLNPNLDSCVLEVAGDDLGNYWLLQRDGSLCFLDHELFLLRECRISLEDLLFGYLESPGIIFDNDRLGIQYPEIAEADDTGPPQTPLDKLRRLNETLPTLARIAIAVRGCQRASPRDHFDDIPAFWHAFVPRLEAIVERCQSVPITGQPISEAELSAMSTECSEAQYAWYDWQHDPREERYCPGLYTGHIKWVARSCRQPCDDEITLRAANHCGASVIWTDGNQEIMYSAAFQDIEYLQSLDLGKAGELGSPVPSEFFGRPFWPDGKKA